MSDKNNMSINIGVVTMTDAMREGFRRAVLAHPSNSDPVTTKREDEEVDFPGERPAPRLQNKFSRAGSETFSTDSGPEHDSK